MNSYVVGTLHQGFDVAQLHTDLLSSPLGYIRVITNQSHTKTCQSLRNQIPDSTESDNTYGLLIKFNAGVLAALPEPLLQ